MMIKFTKKVAELWLRARQRSQGSRKWGSMPSLTYPEWLIQLVSYPRTVNQPPPSDLR
jgi:hypothetical protein